MKIKIIMLASALQLLSGCVATADPAQPAPAAVRQTEERVKAGETLPLTELTAIDGSKVRIDQPGQRKLLIFFATWCSDSQRAFRHLQASALVQQPDLQIVGIGREENQASLSKFASEYQLKFPLVADPDRALYHQFTNQGIPRLVLVDGNNQVVKTFLGEIPDVTREIQW